MREITHPFIKYGVALVMRDNNLTAIDDITQDHLKREIESAVDHFRLKPESEVSNQKMIRFIYSNDPNPNADKGIYLSPSILHQNKTAKKNMYSAMIKMIGELQTTDLDKKTSVTNTIAPVSAEYSGFGGTTIGRAKGSITIKEAALCIITTTTEKKPSMAFKTYSKGKSDSENVAIIPDLSIPEMLEFINLFERIRESSTKDLYTGFVSEKDNKPQRPKIFNGNFPHAPRSSSLGAIALLGAIGAWAKEAKDIEWAKKVLDSLKEKPIYMIGTKTFEVFKYNHFVIDLAKENKLSTVVDSVYYTVLYNQGRRNTGNRIEYQKFDLFTARFLQLFTIPAFKDFLAFRAEYPNQFETLLNKYFINMENIKPEVVKSARELGKWLNYAAYKVADRTIEDKNPVTRKEKIREQKAKSLIEIESSIFSARSGDALIFQAITRAGRASGLDAPAEAELFMTEASTGAISLESAKHLLIAFSRVRNKYEPKDNTETTNDDETDDNESEDLSDAQE